MPPWLSSGCSVLSYGPGPNTHRRESTQECHVARLIVRRCCPGWRLARSGDRGLSLRSGGLRRAPAWGWGCRGTSTPRRASPMAISSGRTRIPRRRSYGSTSRPGTVCAPCAFESASEARSVAACEAYVSAACSAASPSPVDASEARGGRQRMRPLLLRRFSSALLPSRV